MKLVPVYKWKIHFGVYPVGTFVLNFKIAKEGDGPEPDLYISLSIGKFVVTVGKYHHVLIIK